MVNNFLKQVCFFLLLIFSSVIFLTDCRKKVESRIDPNETTELKTIKDMLGNYVEIPKEIKRAALFGGPTGQIAYLLGAQDKLCAVSAPMKNSMLIKEMDPRIKKLPAPRTRNGVINIEELILANPEIVIAGDTDGQIVERKTSFKVAYFESSMDGGFEGIKDEVRFFARVFNKENRAKAYSDYLDQTIQMIKTRVKDIPISKRKIVFNGYDNSHLVTLGGDTFIEEFIQTAGCRNASAEVSSQGKREGLHSGLCQVSMEQVLKWNPDIIVVNAYDNSDIFTDSRWKTVKAAKNNKVYKQPAAIFVLNRPTAEAAFLYTLWLAVTAYPERFQDIDLEKEIIDFYDKIFDFKLKKTHTARMLNGSFASSMMKGIKF